MNEQQQQTQPVSISSIRDEARGQGQEQTQNKSFHLTREEESSIHMRLNELRQKFDHELKFLYQIDQPSDNKNNININVETRTNYDIERRTRLNFGSPCLTSYHCSKLGKLKNSHCDSDKLICTCLPQHVQFNSSLCLPGKFLR